MTIDHQPLADVTPLMLLDWFTHLGETISYGGQIIDRYLAWHPIDHIKWELARQAPAGGRRGRRLFRMVEAFGGRPQCTRSRASRNSTSGSSSESGESLCSSGAHLVGGRTAPTTSR